MHAWAAVPALLLAQGFFTAIWFWLNVLAWGVLPTNSTCILDSSFMNAAIHVNSTDDRPKGVAGGKVRTQEYRESKSGRAKV